MGELNLNCLQVNSAIAYLVDNFWKRYYKDDFQIVWIDWRDEDLHFNLQINDEYRNIDEIYTALWFDIPKKVLFDYYEARLNGEKINLKNFYLMKKDE